MMKNFMIFTSLCFFSLINAQEITSVQNEKNAAEILLESNNKLSIGGYGEVHFNQDFDRESRSNGKLDVHRMVMLFGYSFSEKTKFITEIEFEHVKEVYIEQAFLQHKFNNFLNLRAGLMLIPMGIINEYHEPTTFNGVERPTLDKSLAPTTWREIGIGFTGTILPASLKYQVYMVNGFNGYDGKGIISGKGLRSGRQKGAESYLSSPNFTGKVSYFGVRGLNLGVSAYSGKTQSKLYNGLDEDDAFAVASADSSVLGVFMLGADARYSYEGLELRGQVYLTNLSNTNEYNHFTATGDSIQTPNDVGDKMTGFYIEAGYNIFKLIQGSETKLIPFIRYEKFDTQAKVGSGIADNPANSKDIITAGLTWALAKGAVFKTDIQFNKNGSSSEYFKTFNAGFGVMF